MVPLGLTNPRDASLLEVGALGRPALDTLGALICVRLAGTGQVLPRNPFHNSEPTLPKILALICFPLTQMCGVRWSQPLGLKSGGLLGQ